MAFSNPSMPKVQNLPFLCIETIFKFTPTSKIIRLYSDTVPLPGSFWSLGLETVLKKRLPLSFGADLPRHQAGDPTAVFDAAGAQVASIKHPEAFRFAPILEFIESAFLTVCAAYERSTRGAVLQFYVCDGEAVLSNLQNITALSLVMCEDQTRFEQKDLLASNLKNVLWQLESFVIKRSEDMPYKTWLDQTLCKFLRTMRMHEMSRLRHLHLPGVAFRTMTAQSNSVNCSAQPVLSSLSSLGIWQSDYMSHGERADLMRFVSTYCREVTVLSIFICGEFKPYLDAFRALPGLTTLGMNMNLSTIQLNGLTFDGSEVINSVSDLRIVSASTSYDPGTRKFKITTFFPNANAVASKAGYWPDPLELAASLFGERQLFPAAAKLSCFFSGKIFSCWDSDLTQFLANPHLPEAVDLSQIIFENLAYHANLLTTIYCAMLASSIKSLFMRGPVHREALPCLRSYVDLTEENAKISAWKDRNLGDQPGTLKFTEISEQTDFTILGTKTCGSLKGEQFSIRVVHQLARRTDIF